MIDSGPIPEPTATLFMIPQGFKKTEAGLLPANWLCGSLFDHISITHGFAFRSQHFAASGDYTLMTPGHFYESGGFRDLGDKEKYYSGPIPDGYVLEPGDLVVAMTEQADGLLGSAALIPEDRYYLHNQRLGRIKFRSDSLDARYLYYVFNSSEYRRRVRETAAGTKVKHTSPAKLLQIKVPIPPRSEQRAIAEALSDVDGLLGALEALMAKKRAIKQAVMQQLLTGKTRLPGFSGKWETRRLGEIGMFSKGRGIKREDVSDDGLACIRYGEIYTRYHNYVTWPVSRISSAISHKALPIASGDLLFTGSGETVEEIGLCIAYLGSHKAFAGGDIVVLTPTPGHNSVYLSHLMNHPPVAKQKTKFGQGDAVVHISSHNLAQVEINLPRLEEQDAIATVLLDMDAEIASLERRRDKTRAIKQGMMQQLLTGRVRLVKPESVAAEA